MTSKMTVYVNLLFIGMISVILISSEAFKKTAENPMADPCSHPVNPVKECEDYCFLKGDYKKHTCVFNRCFCGDSVTDLFPRLKVGSDPCGPNPGKMACSRLCLKKGYKTRSCRFGKCFCLTQASTLPDR